MCSQRSSWKIKWQDHVIDDVESLRVLRCTHNPTEQCIPSANFNSLPSGCQVQSQEQTKENSSCKSCRGTNRSTHFTLATARSAPELQDSQDYQTPGLTAQGKLSSSGQVTVNNGGTPSWWSGPLRLRSPGN